MLDRKLIMHDLECCIYGNCDKHKHCGHSLADDCVGKLMENVLKLLKEQEPMKPDSFMDGSIQRFACKKCGKHLIYTKFWRDNYCSKCGQEVKWE